jgi:hypothetical protein
MGYYVKMGTFTNLPILAIFDPLKLPECVYAVLDLPAQTKDTSLYLFKHSVNLRIFDHWSSLPEVTQLLQKCMQNIITISNRTVKAPGLSVDGPMMVIFRSWLWT